VHGLIALRFADLRPIQLGGSRIDAFGDQGAKGLLHARLDLPLHEYFGNGEVMHFHQLVDDQVLGFLLRLMLALREDRLADGSRNSSTVR